MVSGKEYRATIPRPLPSAPHRTECRLVPAFSLQVSQRNTCVIPPPKCNVFKERPIKSTIFRKYYKRGDLPIALDANRTLSWKVDIKKLDYHHYLPMFFEGLPETQEPYKFFSHQGIHDMLTNGGCSKIFPCIPQLIMPIKRALNTRNRKIMISTLKILQHLVKSGGMVGEALVPYYRQLLPILNLYKERNVNIGDAIDQDQVRGVNLADVISDTLELLERTGGEDAFINIKVRGKEYRACVPKPMTGARHKKCCRRKVPAFTVQTMQKNTCVKPPPKCNVFAEQLIETTLFRKFYKSDLPVVLCNNRKLSWKVDITKLDYHHYLPMFFEGLPETEDPFRLICQLGICDLLTYGGSKILPCIPQLIIPIRRALNTKNKSIMISTLKILQYLVKSGEMVGEALVPYYRQILSVVKVYKETNVNIGDAIDYTQTRGENLADVLNNTLQLLEQYGGEDAFINIKYIMPTYESCMMN